MTVIGRLRNLVQSVTAKISPKRAASASQKTASKKTGDQQEGSERTKDD